MATLCNITGTFRDREGNPVALQDITFRFIGSVVGAGDALVPETVTVQTGVSGQVDFDIYPGNYTGYVTVPRGNRTEDLNFHMGVPQAATADIADIIDQSPVLTPSLVDEARDARDAAAASAAQAALFDGPRFDNITDLGADTFLTYTAGQDGTVTAGTIIRVSGQFVEVAASGAVDQHGTTAGGVRWYEAGPDFSTRARMVAAKARMDAAGDAVADGTVWSWGDSAYGALQVVASSGATDLADIPGFLPVAPFTLEHSGAVGDGLTDDESAWTEIFTYVSSIGGGVVFGGANRTYALTAISLPSKCFMRGAGTTSTTLKVHPATGVNDTWLKNSTVDAASSARLDSDLGILDCTIDGTGWVTTRWLSQADGTAVTDPQADYVMGSGALASGISGVNLTAVLTGDAVTSVTINSGGSGWNGHATEPYLPSTVALRFTGGGGSGAAGYATISGGTLTSVTITTGGSGYSTAPAVVTLGGYADINLLVNPGTDRRNPNLNAVGECVSFNKVTRPRIKRVRFLNVKRIALLDKGCKDAVFRDNTFDGCGKKDGPFYAIFAQSYGVPGGGDAWYQDTENCLIEGNTFINCERSAIGWSPTKGGTIRGNHAEGCGESTIFMSSNLHYSGGRTLIVDNTLKANVLTDIAGALIEGGNAHDVEVRGNRLEGSAEQSIGVVAGQRVDIHSNRFVNNGTALTTTVDQRVPYGPFSERYSFNVGGRPTAGEAIHIPKIGLIPVGATGSDYCKGLYFRSNTFVENRSEYPDNLFYQTKTTTSNIGEDCFIEDNDLLGVPAGMSLLDTSISGVWNANIPLYVRRNAGHASATPVVVSHQFAATGSVDILPGFRPSYVIARADVNNGARLRASDGFVSWQADASNNSYVHRYGSDGTSVQGVIDDTEIVRIADPASGSDTCRVLFTKWTETGLQVNCITYSELTNVRFECYP